MLRACIDTYRPYEAPDGVQTISAWRDDCDKLYCECRRCGRCEAWCTGSRSSPRATKGACPCEAPRLGTDPYALDMFTVPTTVHVYVRCCVDGPLTTAAAVAQKDAPRTPSRRRGLASRPALYTTTGPGRSLPHYSRSPKKPTLQLFQKCPESASAGS